MNDIQPPSKYDIIYWSPDDDVFVAEAPGPPGCAADGPTPREALANLRVIAEEWLETAREPGWPVPEPRGRLLFT